MSGCEVLRYMEVVRPVIFVVMLHPLSFDICIWGCYVTCKALLRLSFDICIWGCYVTCKVLHRLSLDLCNTGSGSGLALCEEHKFVTL